MNIYENFIENTGAKKPNLNTKEVLSSYKNELNSIETQVTWHFNQLNGIENSLSSNGYSVAYVKEHMEKEKESMNKSIDELFSNKISSMTRNLENLKERALLSSGNKDVSRNNILKLQSVLNSISEDDKALLFESCKDKDPNVLEILYISSKHKNPILANEIMKHLDKFTGESEIEIVSSQLEQIKGLKSYLTYDFIKSQDVAYSQTAYATLVPGGSISRTIKAYIEDIDRIITQLS